mgnify:CR=1 FL=1
MAEFVLTKEEFARYKPHYVKLPIFQDMAAHVVFYHEHFQLMHLEYKDYFTARSQGHSPQKPLGLTPIYIYDKYPDIVHLKFYQLYNLAAYLLWGKMRNKIVYAIARSSLNWPATWKLIEPWHDVLMRDIARTKLMQAAGKLRTAAKWK